MRDLCAPIAMSRWVLCFLGLYYGMGNPVRRTLHDVSEIIKHFLVTGSEIFLNADNADLICVFPDYRQVSVPEVLVDGRDVALKELEAAGFHGGPLGVQLPHAVQRWLVTRGLSLSV